MLLLFACSVTACGAGGVRARIGVSSMVSMFDQALHIIVTGLPANRRVTIVLRSTDANGISWSSHAVFRADPKGVVDLATASALSGGYVGVNPMGLVESMQPTRHQPVAYIWRQQDRFSLEVEGAHGSTLAMKTFVRRLVAPGVSVAKETLAAVGFVGAFVKPPATTPRHPAVLLIGGSEGGFGGVLSSYALAAAGYPTLDIAYFKEPGLPSQLKDIPLGYFAKALRWMSAQPGVLPHDLYVSGVSRGSEAALLLAVHYPVLVHGVIASSPSDLSFGSFPVPGFPAWTYHGRAVPYFRGLANPLVPTIDPAATIATRRIRGPIFLDCGTADFVWPSCSYAAAIQQGLTAAHDQYPHVLYRYRGAGHFVGSLIPYEPVSAKDSSYRNGDGATPLANSNAEARLWPKVLEFLSGRQLTATVTAPSTPPSPTR